MKPKIHLAILSLLIVFILFGFGSPGSSLKKDASLVECTMDIYAENNISVTIDYVQFTSSLDSKTLYNIPGNGGSDSGGFLWETSQGFAITIKLGASSGTGRVKIFRERTLVHCSNFNNPSIAFTIEIGPGSFCPGAYYVYIEPSSC